LICKPLWLLIGTNSNRVRLGNYAISIDNKFRNKKGTNMRIDGRENDMIRPVRITRNYIVHPAGSVLIEMGLTKVICTAIIEEKVPGFLKGAGSGWITAENGFNNRRLRCP